MKTNVALIGFMGTGKTAVGRLLAKKLNLQFLEMDALIEVRAGKTIPMIFEDGGEIAFRALEIEVAAEVARQAGAVIACGGGIVLNRINIDRLKETSVIVCLTASPAVIMKRVSSQVGQRPLLEVEHPMTTIAGLLKVRKPLYDRAADFTVKTSRLGLDGVADLIVRKLKEDESLDWSK
jgi:shikimate kinase